MTIYKIYVQQWYRGKLLQAWVIWTRVLIFFMFKLKEKMVSHHLIIC